MQKKMDNKISAILIIYNEEKVIERCLKSISGLVDEIIIVHDGQCKDESLEIARKYTNKIYIREHRGLMEGHRVFSIKKATYPWVLFIDADEYINIIDYKKIRNLVKSKIVNGYAFLWKLWNGKKYVTKNSLYKPCLIRRSEIKYLEIIHEVVGVETGKLKEVNITLEHKPEYNNITLDSFIHKWCKWARIHAQYLNKDFKNINKIGYADTDDWSTLTKNIRNRPLLVAPIKSAHVFIDYLYKFRKDINISTLKFSFFQALYIFYVYYNLWKIKRYHKL
jgi:glycosyltransferase involved in cell wall biosynthesis